MDTQEPTAPDGTEDQSTATVVAVELTDPDSPRPALIAHLSSYSQEPAPDGYGLEVEITHLSEHLLALRSPVALQPGTEYLFRLGAGDLAECCGLQVVASRRRPDGLHDIGAVYLKSRLTAAA